VDPYVFFWDSDGHELVGAYVDEAGTCSESLRPGSYRVKVMTNNTAWATRSFEIRSGEETELALVLDSTVRRYISFPVPEPEGWEGVRVFRYVLRDATGMVLDEDDHDAQRWGIPHRYAPALAVGEFSMELILDDGRRYRGSFEVPDLRPSQIPIRIRVTPLR
jgi:hypothetical protein